MRRYWLLVTGIMAFFLVMFFVVEALGVPLLTDPGVMLNRGGWGAAVVGVSLLVADVVLPVPSSLVMIAHGALFGLVPGAALSLAGGAGAAMFGYWMGRVGSPWLGRVITPAEQARAGSLLRRWGVLAVIVTRPVPILAETVSIMAGASALPVARMLLAVTAGLLPAVLIYAATGVYALTFASGTVSFLVVIAVAACVWGAGRWMRTLPR